MTTVHSGQTLTISSGQTGTGDIVVKGGTIDVLSSGTENSPKVSAGGALVLSGGTSISAALSGTTAVAATETVLAGGIASGTVLSANSILAVSAGGTAINTFASGGYPSEIVYSGGVDSGATISAASLVLSGGSSFDATVGENGQVLVSSGGTASGAVLLGAGRAEVYAGGTTVGMIVSASVINGVFDPAYTDISGGVASGTILRDGWEIVRSGGVASGTTVSSGGIEIVSSGGRTSGVIVSGGGTETVNSGGTANGTVISASGAETVSSGGSAVGVTFADSAGTLSLAAPGEFTGTLSGWQIGDVLDFSNATLTNVVENGATLTFDVGSQGYSYALAGVEAGTQVTAQGDGSGGTALELTADVISSGQTLVISGGQTSSGLTVLSGGAIDVLSGGVASAILIDGGDLVVSSGGQASATVVAGGDLHVLSGGTANGTTVELDGIEIVSSGGIANGTTFNNGGTETALTGVVVSNLVVNSGGTLLLAGGTSISASVFGSQPVSSGAPFETPLSGTAFETVLSGGIASNTTVSGSGILTVSSGGLAVDTNLVGHDPTLFYSTPGYLVVSSGGVASNTTGGGSSVETVYAGGTEIGAQLGPGNDLILSGGTSLSAVFLAGSYDTETVSSGGVASSTMILSGYGELLVSEGGLAVDTIVAQAVGLVVLSGGSASATIVSRGGTATLSSGGSDSDATIDSGGTEIVSSGGVASGTIVYGSLIVSSGGTTDDASINSGGTEIVVLGSVASDTTINSGGELLLSGGTAAVSAATFANGGTVAFAGNGGVLEIDGTDMPTGVISGFDITDVIDLASIGFAVGGTASLGAGNVLHIAENNGSYDLQLDPLQNFSSDTFRLLSDQASGTDIVVLSFTSWSGPNPGNRAGDFNTAANWKAGIVPGASDRATINAAGTYTVTSTVDNAVASLGIGDANATLDIAGGTFRIYGTYVSANAGTIAVGDGAALELDGTMTNTGTIAIASTGDATDLVIDGRFVLKGTGTLALGDSADNKIVSDLVYGRSFINESTITGAGTIGDVDLAVRNGSTGVIDATGSSAALTINSNAVVINDGLIEATGSAGLVIESNIDSDGTLAALGGNLDVEGRVSGTGQARIADGATLTFGSAVAATQTVTFNTGSTGTLALGQAQTFAGTVAGLATGDAIDLQNFIFTATTISGVSGTGAAGTDTVVRLTNGHITATIALLNQYANQYAPVASDYTLTSDHRTTPGTLLELAAPHV